MRENKQVRRGSAVRRLPLPLLVMAVVASVVMSGSTGSVYSMIHDLSSRAAAPGVVIPTLVIVQRAVAVATWGSAASASALPVPATVENTAPVANDDAYDTAEDTPLVIGAAGMLGNDSDADNDPVTAALVSNPSNGTLTLNGDGSFTYTPNENFTGSDSFTYKANDGQADSPPANVTLNVTSVNDPPVVNGDTSSTAEDVTLDIAASALTANDTDADGDTLTVSGVAATAETHGTVNLNNDGSRVIYTPEANFNGTAQFNYTAGDGQGGSATSTVTVTVSPAPDADLSISMTDSPDPVTVGGNVTYNVTVNNLGPDAATAVAITDVLPSGVTFVAAASSPSCTEASGIVTCNIGNLDNGAAAMVSIVAQTTTTGTLSNSASVAGAESDPDPANNTTAPITTQVEACAYTVTPSEQTFSAGAATGTVTLATADVCAWTATSDATWLTITSAASGTGSATINYSVAANNGNTSERTATLTIGGRTVTVRQAGVTAGTLTLQPQSLTGTKKSTATVTLTATAPAGGAVVSLQSNNTAVATVPSSATVAAGATSKTFSVTTKAVGVATVVQISATYNGVTQTAQLTVVPPTLKSFTLTPATLAGGCQTSTGKVTLDAKAPTGGAAVTLSNANPAATMPGSVLVPAGGTNASFTIQTSIVSARQQGDVIATYGNGFKKVKLIIDPIGVKTLTLSPNPVVGGQSVTGTVTLHCAASPDDTIVSLSSTAPSVANPDMPSITIPAGLTTGTFTLSTQNPTSTNKIAIIKATANGISSSVTLTVTSSLLTVSAPTAFQVVQRHNGVADIPIKGAVGVGTYDIEARWSGAAWQTIQTGVAGAFEAVLPNQPQGQGTLEVRLKGTTTKSTVLSVGIGDVYVVAGQSNASGRGLNAQTYSHPSRKASLFANSYKWKNLSDPTDTTSGQVDAVSADTGGVGGSYWPLLATHIMADQGVPVAFIPCALGGTSITQWQPGADHEDRTTLYGSMVYRARQAGGIKAVLWHQGENDAITAMSQETYNTWLDSLANSIYADLGVPLVACKLQNSQGIADSSEAAINAAIGEAWGDNPSVVAGPDLSGITTDGLYHLETNDKLATAASLWWTALQSAFY